MGVVPLGNPQGFRVTEFELTATIGFFFSFFFFLREGAAGGGDGDSNRPHSPPIIYTFSCQRSAKVTSKTQIQSEIEVIYIIFYLVISPQEAIYKYGGPGY